MKNCDSCFSSLPGTEGPRVIAFVGPNGSGKSSVTNLLKITNVELGDKRYTGSIAHDKASGEVLLPLVNPDEIAKAVRAESPGLDEATCNGIAFERANAMRDILADAKIDFGFETVGSHHSKVEFLERLKRGGYYVAVLFISTEDARINVRRVKQRQLAGGHGVPTEKVVNRYQRTMGLLPRYFSVADFMAIYDNSEDHTRIDGVGPKLLLVKRDGNAIVTENGYGSAWLKGCLPEAFD